MESLVIFSTLLCIGSVFLSSIMHPCPSKCRNRPVSLDPKSLTLAELNAPKEFPYSSSLGTKCRDYWHEDAFGMNVRMATKHRSLALTAQLH